MVCGVVGIHTRTAPSIGEGLLLVWGSKVPSKFLASQLDGYETSLSQTWYLGERSKERWYTAVYPWTPAGSTMDAELSDFGSVQKVLSRCCEKVVQLTDATELISSPDGSCTRTWVVETQGTAKRVCVKAAITPVVFLGQEMIDIAVTVVPADKRQRLNEAHPLSHEGRVPQTRPMAASTPAFEKSGAINGVFNI